MDSKPKQLKPLKTQWVSSTDSPEYTQLSWALTHSQLVGLDAEWKPSHSHQPCFPTVSLLQIACRLNQGSDSRVFLVDLVSVHLLSIWQLLRDLFVSPNVLKLGFKFKQDLIYLSSTFRSAGCDSGFDRVEPFLDITSAYYHLQHKESGKKFSKDTKSLAAICEDVLGVPLSKELQCSDWSCRPLTEEQKSYAAADAQCLLEIFTFFEEKVLKEGNALHNYIKLHPENAVLGLKEILEKFDRCDKVLRSKFCQASDIVKSSIFSEIRPTIHSELRSISKLSCGNTTTSLDVSLSRIVQTYGEKILLKESDKKPRTSRRKGRKRPSVGLTSNQKNVHSFSSWEGPPPWDITLGGDGCPKFLCDLMVEGLAKHLRCVGIDAATPYSRRPEPRHLLDQADKEKRVILTRDEKLLRHSYLIRNQVYRVKSHLKNEQLLEIIDTFQLNICEEQLMSRCTKCNGRFIQKPLTTEEAIEASKGFQVIPKCLFKKNLEFWQCMDCKQVYWEPYRQCTTASQHYSKLSPNFHGPFRFTEKIGSIACKLALPDGCHIHPVFLVLALTKKLGIGITINPLFPDFAPRKVWLPEKLLDRHMVKRNNVDATCWLIKWKGHPIEEATWKDYDTVIGRFPDFPA